MSILKSGLKALAIGSFSTVGVFLGAVGIGFATMEIRVVHHRFGEAYDRFQPTKLEQKYCTHNNNPGNASLCARYHDLNKRLEDSFKGFTADYRTLLGREFAQKNHLWVW